LAAFELFNEVSGSEKIKSDILYIGIIFNIQLRFEFQNQYMFISKKRSAFRILVYLALLSVIQIVSCTNGQPSANSNANINYNSNTQIRKSGQEVLFFTDDLSFSSAKKILLSIHSENPKTFYCGCVYKSVRIKGKDKIQVDHTQCGYSPRKDVSRAHRLEWEHVVPAHAFGNTRSCWRETIPGCKKPGRSCCAKKDAKYRKMETDFHNLQPAIGEVNNDRSNFRFSQFLKEEDVPAQYGRCKFYTDFKNKRVQPPPDVRGNIARTYFYMKENYSLPIADREQKLFTIWNRLDPPDEWEIKRNLKIEKIQGNQNHYISDYFKKTDRKTEETDISESDRKDEKDTLELENNIDNKNKIDTFKKTENLNNSEGTDIITSDSESESSTELDTDSELFDKSEE
jgi:deoxyribonuclease I